MLERLCHWVLRHFIQYQGAQSPREAGGGGQDSPDQDVAQWPLTEIGREDPPLGHEDGRRRPVPQDPVSDRPGIMSGGKTARYREQFPPSLCIGRNTRTLSPPHVVMHRGDLRYRQGQISIRTPSIPFVPCYQPFCTYKITPK